MTPKELKELKAQLREYKNKESKHLINEINCYTFLSVKTKTELNKVISNTPFKEELTSLLEAIASDMNSYATSLKKERESVVKQLKLALYDTKKQAREDKKEYAARLEEAENHLEFVKKEFSVKL